ILCFFFSSRRRHTRFSRDWSSDVCSSDLRARFGMGQPRRRLLLVLLALILVLGAVLVRVGLLQTSGGEALRAAGAQQWTRTWQRSEERRVGKECRSGGAPEHREARSSECR